MCLILDKDMKAQILTEPMTVYKVVNKTSDGNYISLYMRFQYEVDTLYDGKLELLRHLVRNTVEEGFHFYTTKETALSYAATDEGRYVVRCKLPIGSQVYINPNYDEGASDKIILTKHTFRYN